MGLVDRDEESVADALDSPRLYGLAARDQDRRIQVPGQLSPKDPDIQPSFDEAFDCLLDDCDAVADEQRRFSSSRWRVPPSRSRSSVLPLPQGDDTRTLCRSCRHSLEIPLMMVGLVVARLESDDQGPPDRAVAGQHNVVRCDCGRSGEEVHVGHGFVEPRGIWPLGRV